jgi:hypothetical protein
MLTKSWFLLSLLLNGAIFKVATQNLKSFFIVAEVYGVSIWHKKRRVVLWYYLGDLT